MLASLWRASHQVRSYSVQKHALRKSAENIPHFAIALQPQQTASKTKYLLSQAIVQCKEKAKCKFDETVELAVQLGVDPRKPNQNVRGVVSLPFGTGKPVRVAVFARGTKAEEARSAGASIVGAEDLIEIVQSGKLEFDRCIATPDMMSLVGRVARILGPRGLMPNPKLGTLTLDVVSAVNAAKSGQVEYRAEKNGVIHAGIGRVSFTEDALLGNIRSFMLAISDAKPEALKGKYIRKAHLTY
uniref:Ribosomal protein n=1 Tax=Albugo laibachii Nc14 TaxID=890382 RepID=F0WQ50_9STRA|nr:50S ribosomal protein L1 putative [Albugo laibachii Nc14]|eukprot:CCA23455.1 50S ribosomal protein L1 putative [Albugo laibachii Nc14]